MELIHIIVFTLLTILFIVVFILGYVIGKFSSNNGVSNTRPNKYSNEGISIQTSCNIDDSKFVSKINTDNLQKKYDQLGETKISQDSIDQSVNKLKNIKK